MELWSLDENGSSTFTSETQVLWEHEIRSKILFSMVGKFTN